MLLKHDVDLQIGNRSLSILRMKGHHTRIYDQLESGKQHWIRSLMLVLWDSEVSQNFWTTLLCMQTPGMEEKKVPIFTSKFIFQLIRDVENWFSPFQFSQNLERCVYKALKMICVTCQSRFIEIIY